MRQFLKKLLLRPVLWISNRYSSRPDKDRVFAALTDLHQRIVKGEVKKGPVLPLDLQKDRFIIFSDQHKGRRNGADDFVVCEANYLAALEHYNSRQYHFISLGDSEELWENSWPGVRKAQMPTFEKERAFLKRKAFTKIFGNHDLFWDNDPFAPGFLKEVYEEEVPIYEGVVLKTRLQELDIDIFCTHGHQGDSVSDGNWFSKFFVSRVWAPLQSYLQVNPNTPAYDAHLKTLHNSLMYEWSAQQENILLITGHTHQPIFESLTHIERLYRQLLFARQMKDESMVEALQKEITLRKFGYNTIDESYLQLKPTYFNSGCCCFSDGDITGIEIEENCFRLIKWHTQDGLPQRVILEETPLEELIQMQPKKQMGAGS